MNLDLLIFRLLVRDARNLGLTFLILCSTLGPKNALAQLSPADYQRIEKVIPSQALSRPGRPRGLLAVTPNGWDGKDHAFYSGLGQKPDIYWNPAMLQHFLAETQFAMGNLPADATPGSQLPLPKGQEVHQAPSVRDLDPLLARVSSYDYGQSRSALVELGDWVRDAAGIPSLCKEAETRFLAYLKSKATLASKDYICRQLSVIGTEASASQLAAMLLAPDTSDMARYAIERIPGNSINDWLRRN